MAEESAKVELVPNKPYDVSYTLFSTFREEASHGVGDPYSDAAADAKSARHGGKRLAMQPNLTGRNPEVFFDKKVRSLAEGDQYLDPAVVEREIKNRVGGKSVSDKAFFPPKNTKHSACPGDPSACLGAVGLLGSDWQDRERDDSGPSLKGKKNLYVNPPRRGGCGSSLQDRTIGQNPPKYMPDPYQNGRELGRELRRKARARIPKPFNSAPNSGAGLFNANPHGYSPGPAYVEEKKAAADEKEKRKAFKPVNPPPTGAAYCTLSSIGRDYVSEPVKEAEYTPRDAAKVVPFKPCAGTKERLSMWTVNPYQYDARPPPDLDFTLFD